MNSGVNAEILAFISQRRQAGIPQDAIKAELLQAGWPEAAVTSAFLVSPIAGPAPMHTTYGNPIPPFQTFEQAAPSGNGKKVALIFMAIVVVLALSGAGVYAYMVNNPEKMLQKMMTKYSQVKTLTFDGTVNARVNTTALQNEPSPETQNIGTSVTDQLLQSKTQSFTMLHFSGVSDVNDINNPKGTLALNFSTDALAEDSSQSIVELEMRYLENALYLDIKQLQEATKTSTLPANFLNQWMKIDLQEMEKKNNPALPPQSTHSLSKEQQDKMLKSVAQSHVFLIKKYVGDETIEGNKTYHYTFEIDKTELQKLLINLSNERNTGAMTAQELQTYNSELTQYMSLISFSGGELWIGKKDLMPYQIKLSVNVLKEKTLEQLATMDVTLQLKDFDKPVTVVIPTPFKTMEEVMKEMMSSYAQQNSSLSGSDTVLDE